MIVRNSRAKVGHCQAPTKHNAPANTPGRFALRQSRGASRIRDGTSVIAEFATALDCPTPLLNACAGVYTAAMAQGRGSQDTAAVCAVLAEWARLPRAET